MVKQIKKVMNKIEQIKTYPQNQKKEWRLCQSSEAKYMNEAIDEFLEVIKVINSLPEEPVSEDLEEAAKKHACQNHAIPLAQKVSIESFKSGAQWQQEQFEQNRLKACDAQTKEEAEREWNFVEHMIKEEHRQPTYSDAIEYGMKLQKDKDDRDLLMSDNRNFDKCYELGKKDMKEEMMTAAADAYISDEITGKSLRFDSDAFMAAWNKYKVGDKLKLIIIKED